MLMLMVMVAIMVTVMLVYATVGPAVGPWMDTNLVLPLTGREVDRCRVVFDYWLEADALQQAAASTTANAADADASSSSGGGLEASAGCLADAVRSALQSQFVQDSLASSHQVQVRAYSTNWAGTDLLGLFAVDHWLMRYGW
jgi:hypothetical protein